MSNEQKFFLYSSSDMQLLAKQLAAIIDTPPINNNESYFFNHIFHTDKVLVQSRGIEKFLNISLATENAVTGNIFYPFPTSFINNEIFAKLFKSRNFYKFKDYFSPEKMTWRIFIELKNCLQLKEFLPFKKYLQDAQTNLELRYFQLASVIAEHFDRYLVFRPDLIVAWDNGENPLSDDEASHWQKILWNRISAGATEYHFASLYFEFMEQVGDLTNFNFNNKNRHNRSSDDLFNALELDFSALQSLQRIFLFGFSSMPPAFLDIFNVLSHVIEVHCFYLNPCVEDWSYSRSLKDYYKRLQKTNSVVRSTTIANLEIDFLQIDFEFENNLLGSWGKQGREFFHLLQNINGIRYYNLDETVYADEYGVYNFAENSLLEKVQNGIKTMTTNNCDDQNNFISKDDDSVIINSCHSPLRELEVLKNYLLKLFSENSDIKVQDILVMIPDIEQYSPYIEAVFKTVDFRNPQWMFSTISDCSNALRTPEVATFIKLLELLNSDCHLSEIMEIINSNVIMQRYNLNEDDLKGLNKLLERNAVAYGFDDECQDVGDVKININSWHSGLRRMLSGYAIMQNDDYMPNDDYKDDFSEKISGNIFKTKNIEVIPDDNIEGNNVQLVGKLYDFIESVYNLRSKYIIAQKNRNDSLQFYLQLAKEVVEEFFAVDDDSAKLLHGAINSVAMQAEYASIKKDDNNNDNIILEQKLSLDVFKELLKNNFNLSINSGNFLHGGITFCKAQPMRSIPAKVVCLLGLGEKYFPRKNYDSSFNLMNNKRRFGDRNAKDDDRYFFLETVLSAKKKVYLSYVGQSIKDNSPLVASSVIEELLDHIDSNFKFVGHENLKISEKIRLFQPLNGYSMQYFNTNNKLFYNYSQSDYETMKMTVVDENATSIKNSSNNKVNKLIKLRDYQQNIPVDNNILENVKFSQLIDYFCNPSRFYVRNILNLDIKYYQNSAGNDYETLTIEKNTQRNIFNYLIDEFPQNIKKFFVNRELNDETLYHYYHLKGIIPHGEMGKVMFRKNLHKYHEKFYNFSNDYCEKIQIEKFQQCDFKNLHCQLELDFDHIYFHKPTEQYKQLFLHYDRIYENNKFNYLLWGIAINHYKQHHNYDDLPINGCGGYALLNDEYHDFSFLGDAQTANKRLEILLTIYKLRRCYPLPFFMKSFFQVQEAIQKGQFNSDESKKNVLHDIATNWQKNEYDVIYQDGDDDFIRYCFGEEFPNLSEFSQEFCLLCELLHAVLDSQSNNEKLSELQNNYLKFRNDVSGDRKYE